MRDVSQADVEELAGRIRAQIEAEASLEPPWHCAEKELRHDFDASRDLVSAAMHHLRALGIVEMLPGKGWYPYGVRPRAVHGH